MLEFCLKKIAKMLKFTIKKKTNNKNVYKLSTVPVTSYDTLNTP